MDEPATVDTAARARLWARLRAGGLDAVVVGAGVAAQIEIWTVPDVENPAAMIPFALVWGFGLLARHRAPFWAQIAVMGAAALQALLLEGNASTLGSLFLVGVLIAWTIGAELEGWRAATAAGTLLALVVIINLRSPEDTGVGDYVFPSVLFGMVLTAGMLASQRARTAEALVERAQLAEQQRHERQMAALAEERTRIARELHDVVAHGLSVIAVQAGAAQEVLDRDPGRARDALMAVETTARDALEQMRRMLGVLRADDDGAARAPQPGVGDLPDLLAQVRTAGLPVTLDVTGTPRDVPPDVGLAAYRIVQEALTNTLRHAGPARASVDVVYGATGLTLRIADDGRPGSSPPRAGGGHGLVGMRERAAVHGGTVEAGPRPGGGFLVRAVLPVRGWSS